MPEAICVTGRIEAIDRSAGVIELRGGEDYFIGQQAVLRVSGVLAAPHLRRRKGTWLVAHALVDSGGEIREWRGGPVWLGSRLKPSRLISTIRLLKLNGGPAVVPPLVRKAAARGSRLQRIYGRKDEQGRRLCCLCGEPVPKGRRDWCSQACVDRYLDDSDWGRIRDKVIQRDQNTCQICGYVRPSTRGMSHEQWRQVRKMEVDHIVRVADGGGNELSNLRLLCRPCHAKVTAGLHVESPVPAP